MRYVEDSHSDSFETHTLDVHCDATAARVRIRNTATRGGKHLDSIQTLYLQTDRGVVSEVRIEVDDQSAVEELGLTNRYVVPAAEDIIKHPFAFTSAGEGRTRSFHGGDRLASSQARSSGL